MSKYEIIIYWSDEDSADPLVTSYNVYYDQAGKSQLLTTIPADQGLNTSFTDSGLTNGQQYCYKVTSTYADCESGFSNVICTSPEAPGQALPRITVDSIATGFLTGKGKNVTFVLTDTFSQGDEIIFQAYLLDEDLAPVGGAVAELTIDGPSSAIITTGISDADGMAEAAWATTSKRNGTPTGLYTVTTTDVIATGFEWDGVPTSTEFTLK